MSEILPQSFVLNNREDVIKFENLTKSYIKDRALSAEGLHLSLVKAYDHCQKRGDDKKLFYVLLDIYINFGLLHCDMISANQGKLIGGNVLNSEENFFEKMDMHRFYSSFIFRYRAMWDKLMGLLVLICVSEEQYEKYTNSKSRLAKFEKICKEFNILQIDSVIQIIESIREFDDNFRTPEAHGAGALRKWSFLMNSESPVDNLLGYWNEINRFMAVIGDMFNTFEQRLK